jgi:RNA polymerase sigma-70 factor (ECF subfamily)
MIYSFEHSRLNKDATSEQLMARVKNRDESALAELHRRHAPMLRGVIGGIIKDDGDIDDLIQEVFLQVWDRASRYLEEKGRALGWISTIARCRAIDKVRRNQSYFRMQERLRMEPAREAYQHTREEAHSSDVSGIFKTLLAQLPAAQREALHLSYYCDMSHGEIASHTGIPLGTIKTRLQLALGKIRAAVLAFEDFKGWWPSQDSGALLTI